LRRYRHLTQALQNGEATVEVTARTVQSRFLLKPDSHVNSIIAGVLARAKERFGFELHGFVFLSNHFHALATFHSVKQMSKAMQYIMSNIARKVGRYRGWRGPFWARRYRGIEVCMDDETLLARFDYLLRQGVKEGLVNCPMEWPGLHIADYLGRNCWTVRGHWDNLTKRFRLREAGKRARTKDYRNDEVFEIDPLPCWRHKERREIWQYVLERIAEIREEYADIEAMGPRKVMAQRITDSPKHTSREPAPDVHAKDPEMRKLMRAAYRAFAAAYMEASARLYTFLKAEEEPYYFPSGSHPPRPPAVAEFA